jgi:hypothetical protein
MAHPRAYRPNSYQADWPRKPLYYVLATCSISCLITACVFLSFYLASMVTSNGKKVAGVCQA